jgi:hypothetical protein
MDFSLGGPTPLPSHSQIVRSKPVSPRLEDLRKSNGLQPYYMYYGASHEQPSGALSTKEPLPVFQGPPEWAKGGLDTATTNTPSALPKFDVPKYNPIGFNAPQVPTNFNAAPDLDELAARKGYNFGSGANSWLGNLFMYGHLMKNAKIAGGNAEGKNKFNQENFVNQMSNEQQRIKTEENNRSSNVDYSRLAMEGALQPLREEKYKQEIAAMPFDLNYKKALTKETENKSALGNIQMEAYNALSPEEKKEFAIGLLRGKDKAESPYGKIDPNKYSESTPAQRAYSDAIAKGYPPDAAAQIYAKVEAANAQKK